MKAVKSDEISQEYDGVLSNEFFAGNVVYFDFLNGDLLFIEPAR